MQEPLAILFWLHLPFQSERASVFPSAVRLPLTLELSFSAIRWKGETKKGMEFKLDTTHVPKTERH